MDVKREIAAANRRIQKQIDESARAALIRIGVDVDAEENARRAELVRKAVEAAVLAAEFGSQMRLLNARPSTSEHRGRGDEKVVR